MTAGSALLALSLLAPLALLLAGLSKGLRAQIPALLGLAPVPALLAALFASGSSLALPAPFRLTLALDPPGAMLLGAAALIWIAGGLSAPAYLEGKGRYVAWWLLTLTGSIGVFLADDLVSFYLLYSLVSLAAYGLVSFEATPFANKAGAIYVACAVLGEAFLLAAFVLLAQGTPSGSLSIGDAVAALPASPFRDAAIALILLGFGLKIALVPLHVWMPLTYTAAPIPAAAVLSGAGVKAGVIGLIRFLPFAAALPGWGETLTVLGLVSAFFGVAIGITQKNPKTVLAYSSISQMGVIATVIGMGLAAGSTATPVDVAFYAAHHVLVKGGLFLAVGVVAATGSRRLWPVAVPAAIVALGIGGLPFTGGALAKLAVKDGLGYGLVGTLGALSAAASTLLMLHFLRRLTASASTDREASPPRRLLLVWWAIAALAVIVPWVLYPLTGGTLADAFAPDKLWDSIWPVALGAILAAALFRFGARVPEVPPGDMLALGERIVPAASRLSAAIERFEAWLREWPIAGTMLLLLSICLAAAMFAAR